MIAAHDIKHKDERLPEDDVYGYRRIVAPENYEEIHIPKGMGTVFWVKKEEKYLEIIQDLQNYAGVPFSKSSL